MKYDRPSLEALYIDVATSYEGCNAQTDGPRFLGLVAPFEAQADRAMYLKQFDDNRNSSCGVAGCGIIRVFLRRLRALLAADGVVVAELDRVLLELERALGTGWWAAYVRVATRHGAYVLPGAGRVPGVGCLFHEAIGRAQHWRSIIAALAGRLTTIDGGSKNAKGYQQIVRAFVTLKGYLDASNGKTIDCWIDVIALALAILATGSSTATSSQTTSSSTPSTPAAPVSLPPTLRRGASGEVAARWQRIVGATADGVFGAGTEAKTKAWQGRHGLTADGVVGPATWRAALATGGTRPDLVATSPAVSLFTTGNEGAPLEGVDVSDENPLIGPEGIAGLRAAGIRFAFVRLTLGLQEPDTNAAAHIRALRAAAVDVIAGYGVPYPPRPFSKGLNDAREQALELDGLIRAHALNGRVMIDAEEVRSGGKVVKASGAQHRETLEAYASTLIERGHRPILYTGKWWWDQFPELAASKLLTSLDMMLSNYSDPIAAVPLPSGFSRMKILQYAGSDPDGRVGRIAGIPTPIDRNRYAGPLDDLRA